jgi:hypothetical protein
VSTIVLVLAATTAVGVLAALWQRAEARAEAAAAVLARAQLAAAERAAVGDDARHVAEVQRLEAVIVDLRDEVKERDDEIEALLSDDPAGAGEHLARVLADVPARDSGDGGPGVQPTAGAGGGGGGGGGERS